VDYELKDQLIDQLKSDLETQILARDSKISEQTEQIKETFKEKLEDLEKQKSENDDPSFQIEIDQKIESVEIEINKKSNIALEEISSEDDSQIDDIKHKISELEELHITQLLMLTLQIFSH
jgi:ribosome-associated translation inhibitor RaiA